MDRLFAMWQAVPGEEWRLDPDQVYGNETDSVGLTGIASPMEPWAGNPDNNPAIQLVRPWAPPENQQESKTSRHASVVRPPCYDTLPFSVTLTAPSAGAPITFQDIPEGQTTVRAAVFSVVACRELTLEIIAGPGPGFGTPLGASVSTGHPKSFSARPAYVWISYTGTTAGDSAAGSVTIRCVETGQEWVIPITANTVAKPTVASMLVLDKSGSMGWASGVTDFPKRVELLRFAAPHFVELLDEHDGVGIVSFDHNAQSVMEVKPAGIPVFGPGRIEAKQKIHSPALDPGGATSIGAGFQLAHDGLDPVTGFDHKAVVVFTDGFENYAPYIADVAGIIGARVFAIGLGTAEYLNPSALEALAAGTGGHLLLTGDLDTHDLFRLSKYFLQILALHPSLMRRACQAPGLLIISTLFTSRFTPGASLMVIRRGTRVAVSTKKLIGRQEWFETTYASGTSSASSSSMPSEKRLSLLVIGKYSPKDVLGHDSLSNHGRAEHPLGAGHSASDDPGKPASQRHKRPHTRGTGKLAAGGHGRGPERNYVQGWVHGRHLEPV